MISSAENCFSNEAIMVPFLPSRIVFSICASVVAFCQAASLKFRTPCLAKTAFGSPSLPWQGAQLSREDLRRVLGGDGGGCGEDQGESGGRGEGDESGAADGHEVSPPG